MFINHENLDKKVLGTFEASKNEQSKFVNPNLTFFKVQVVNLDGFYLKFTQAFRYFISLVY